MVSPGGIIRTIAGNGTAGYSGDNGPATKAQIKYPAGLSFGHDGVLYLADRNNHVIRAVAPPFPGLSLYEIPVPSEDGSEFYIFDSEGRHLRTLDALTGAIRYELGYDSGSRLITITDESGNVTAIQRDMDGIPTAIASPHGQRTTLSAKSNGYLSGVSNPEGETFQPAYTDDGLLSTLTDRRNFIHNFTYDGLGLLTKDEDPAGGSKSLSRTEITNGYQVEMATAMGRTTNYSVENQLTGDQRRVNIYPDGTKTDTLNKSSGSRTIKLSDGTNIETLIGPDPRFGMQSPLIESATVKTPGGIAMTLSQSRAVTLTDPDNPLSLSTLTDTINRNGQTYTIAYDAVTRTFTKTTPVGRQETTKIDPLGRVIEEQRSGLNLMQYTYDAHGRLAGVIQAAGAETRPITLEYNLQGYLGSVTDPLSNVLRFEYDLMGRVKKEILPDLREIAYDYDSNGNLTSVTPPGKPSHSFTHNPVNLILEYNPPDVSPGTDKTQYSYNIDRQLTQILRPDGQTVDFAYDTGGRLSTITFPGGSVV